MWKKLLGVSFLSAALLFCGCARAVETGGKPEQEESRVEIQQEDQQESQVQDEAPEDTWTVLLYLCGSDLESGMGAATFNLDGLREAEASNSVHFIAQTGGSSEWQTDEVDSTVLQRFEIEGDMLTEVERLPMANMGDPNTLADFVSWGTKQYPAEKYMVVIWDHGGGPIGGASSDELYEGAIMSLPDIAEGLSAADVMFDIIGFDACLMGNLEVAQALAPYGRYLVASEEVEPGYGWNYEGFGNYLVEHPGCDGVELGKIICDTYEEQNSSEESGAADILTLSVVDMEKTKVLVEKLGPVFREIGETINHPEQYREIMLELQGAEKYAISYLVDIGDFLDKLELISEDARMEAKAALSDSVLYKINGNSRQYSHGLNMVFYNREVTSSLCKEYVPVAAIPEHLAYLDALCYNWRAPKELYENIEPMEERNPNLYKLELKSNLNEDGGWELALTEGTDSVLDVVYKVFMIDEKQTRAYCLGDGTDMETDWENGRFRETFDGAWMAIDGVYCYMNEIESQEDYILYNIPIELEGMRFGLRVAYRFEPGDEKNGTYEFYGLWNGDETAGGLPSKNTVPLKDGDTFDLLLPETNITLSQMAQYRHSGTITYDSQTTSIEKTPLKDGMYIMYYQVENALGNQKASEPLFITIKNGKLTRTEMEPMLAEKYGFELGEEEEAADYTEDFYHAVNQKQLDRWKIPADEPEISWFQVLGDESYEKLDKIIRKVSSESSHEKGSDLYNIRAMNLTGLDQKTRNQEGYGKRIEAFLKQVDESDTVEELLKASFQFQRNYSYHSFGGLFIMADGQDSSVKVLCLDSPQTGLEREEWFSQDPEAMKRVEEYKTYIRKLYEARGMTSDEAGAAVERVTSMMKDLASASLTMEEQYDTKKTYNVYSAKDIEAFYGNMIPFQVLEEIYGCKADDKIVVRQPNLHKKLAGYLTEEQLPLLKEYVKTITYSDFAELADMASMNASLEYESAIRGVEEKKDFERTVSEMTQDALGFECGRIFCEKYFDEAKKKDVTDLTHQIIEVYDQRLADMEWMSDTTRQEARRKLETLTIKVGYPDSWPQDKYDLYLKAPEEGGIYADNILEVLKVNQDYDFRTRNEPVDKTIWGMTPQTVNAYYSPVTNEIAFPAAILQPPFYDAKAQPVTNLGGIGMVIGHEITHAFDTSGSQYDEKGNLRNWWTAEDKQKFEALAQKVIRYYDTMEVNGIPVNGSLTVTENVADLGAISCVTEIAKKRGYDLKELYKAYAVLWARKSTDEYLAYCIATDTHAPSVIRINAVLSAIEDFYTAFDVKEGDGMYQKPEVRPKIW